MNFSIKNLEVASKEEREALIFFFWQKEKTPLAVEILPPQFKPEILSYLKLRDFQGKEAQFITLYPQAGKVKRLILAGLGKRANFSELVAKRTAKALYLYLESLNLKSTAIQLPKRLAQFKQELLANLLIEGLFEGLYVYNELKQETKDDKKRLEQVDFLITQGAKKDLLKICQQAPVIYQGIAYFKDLVNRPANLATPSHLAREASKLAQENLGPSKAEGKKTRVQIIGEAQARKIGMGAFSAITQGSDQEGKFIVLDYNRQAKKTLVLVGKGVTFDAGGLNLKPLEWQTIMKSDMAGAGLILAIFKILPQLKAKYRIVGLLPCVENLPSGKAIKAGDVVKTLAGKTVEIVNTDAEGRLILADALTYAQRYQPQAILDFATLTGIIIFAIGNYGAGVISNNQKLLAQVKKASQESGERLVEFPLWSGHKEDLKSQVADLKNVGDRRAGINISGVFLHEFVADRPWAHFDIASVAMDKDGMATGWGVKLLVEFLKRF